jgi:hypothetical protein
MLTGEGRTGRLAYRLSFRAFRFMACTLFPSNDKERRPGETATSNGSCCTCVRVRLGKLAMGGFLKNRRKSAIPLS